MSFMNIFSSLLKPAAAATMGLLPGAAAPAELPNVSPTAIVSSAEPQTITPREAEDQRAANVAALKAPTVALKASTVVAQPAPVITAQALTPNQERAASVVTFLTSFIQQLTGLKTSAEAASANPNTTDATLQSLLDGIQNSTSNSMTQWISSLTEHKSSTSAAQDQDINGLLAAFEAAAKDASQPTTAQTPASAKAENPAEMLKALEALAGMFGEPAKPATLATPSPTATPSTPVKV